MTVFVDTSALYALMDRDDANHPAAAKRWKRILDDRASLLTSNYVVVETSALVQHRLGIRAVRLLHDDVLPVIETHWITEE